MQRHTHTSIHRAEQSAEEEEGEEKSSLRLSLSVPVCLFNQLEFVAMPNEAEKNHNFLPKRRVDQTNRNFERRTATSN